MNGVTRNNKCEDCGIEDKNRNFVNIRADKIERCNPCALKIKWPLCITCGKPKQDYTDGYDHIKQIKDGDCFSCYHWSGVFSQSGKSVRTQHGTHYSFNADQPISHGQDRHLGHGGRYFKIAFEDGGVVITNNLWCQGEMSKYWIDKYPPNAKVEEATLAETKLLKQAVKN